MHHLMNLGEFGQKKKQIKEENPKLSITTFTII